MEVANKESRLKRFYGDVAKDQNKDIIRFISGRHVLDVGCGYGSLIHQINSDMKDMEAVGIDIDPESIRLAKELYGIDVKPVSVYKMDFPDNHFDTVILREAIHHFDTEESLRTALSQIRRVCRKELIIFDPNPNFIVKLSRKMIGHIDPEAPVDKVLKTLKENGFDVKICMWRDIIAFPLSGGFVGRELIPNIGFVKDAVLRLDKIINMIMRTINLQRHVCWRYIIYAQKANG